VARDAVRVELLVGYDTDSLSLYGGFNLSDIRPVEDDPATPSHPRPRFEFDSVAAIFRHWRITKRDFLNWRHIGPISGSINGLPDSHGVLWVTNGIMCIIEQANDRYYEGHLQWFEPATLDDQVELSKGLSKLRHEKEDVVKERKVSLTEYLNLDNVG
jgi:hypothetical protein